MFFVVSKYDSIVDMQFTKTHKIIALVCFVAIIVGGYFFIRKNNKPVVDNTGASTATSTNGSIHVGTANSGYTIEQVPIGEGQGVPKPIPDLNRSSKGYGSIIVTDQAIAQALPKITELQTMLKKNPANFDAWIDLGIYQKMAGDYVGTSLSWQYASKLAPKDFISLGDLGNLYGYFLHDKTKAESYYLAAIKNGPQIDYLYIQLSEVYRDIFLDKNKALDIVNKGLSALPNDLALTQMKASLSGQ